ncbi:MAG: dual specificity phosphatase domain protein [Hyperionvirus sp.]|uniref:Dual specificity phosphatase domain protein n=1 Tax=Hyperionvirus sp. TaxID=2487770 RepID=A0A3G5AAZ9_9VIRU|nr:MAG: dual specificity phosphatase domain protein [Hyperionvirus sp.]
MTESKDSDDEFCDLEIFFALSALPIRNKRMHLSHVHHDVFQVTSMLSTNPIFGGQALATKITEHLFLTNDSVPVSPPFLHFAEIKGVITIMNNSLKIHRIKVAVAKFKIPHTIVRLNDVSTESLAEPFAIIFPLLLKAEENKQTLIIHCEKGISRSASIVIMFLMKSRKMIFSDAFNFVLKLRPQINPNAGFMRQMQEFEKTLFDRAIIRR